jgi:uncharacterized protein YndB with AHSA1/START domain
MPEVLSTPVRSSVVVAAPVDEAFSVFTDDMASWWPPDHHILQSELASMEFEPRVGGAIVDHGVDGSSCRWARVLAYDPPHRVVFSWDITLAWQVETDPARTSEVEVTFTPAGDGRTLVELEHRHIERHGDGWEQMHGAVGSPNGWDVGMRRFADRIASGGGVGSAARPA